MTVIVLRPSTGWVFGAPDGAAINAPNSLWAISDDNWGTYHQGHTVQGNGLAAYPMAYARWGDLTGGGLPNPRVPPLGQIRQLRVGCRMNLWSGGASVQSWNLGMYPQRTMNLDINAVRAGLATHYTDWWSTASGGAAWTEANMNSCSALSFPSSYNIGADFWVDYIENWVEVDVNFPPSLAVTGPSGIVNTLTPTITFTYSDPEGDAKERHTAKVFKQPSAGWGSLDPETNTADLLYGSGDVATGGLTQAIGTAVKRGITYRAYAKAGDAGSGGRYGHWRPGPDFKADESAWGSVNA